MSSIGNPKLFSSFFFFLVYFEEGIHRKIRECVIRFKSVFVEFFKGPRKLCVDFANVHNHSFYPISMK